MQPTYMSKESGMFTKVLNSSLEGLAVGGSNPKLHWIPAIARFSQLNPSSGAIAGL